MATDLVGYTDVTSTGLRVHCPWGEGADPVVVFGDDAPIRLAGRGIFVSTETVDGQDWAVTAPQDDGDQAWLVARTGARVGLGPVNGEYPVLITRAGRIFTMPSFGRNDPRNGTVRREFDLTGRHVADVVVPRTSQGFAGVGPDGEPLWMVPGVQTIGGLAVNRPYWDGDFMVCQDNHADRLLGYHAPSQTWRVVANVRSSIGARVSRISAGGSAVFAISLPGLWVPWERAAAYTPPPVTIPTIPSQQASMLVIGDPSRAETIAVANRPTDPRNERTRAIFVTEWANDIEAAATEAAAHQAVLCVYRDRATYGPEPVYRRDGVTVLPTLRCYPERAATGGWATPQARGAALEPQVAALEAAGYRGQIAMVLPVYTAGGAWSVGQVLAHVKEATTRFAGRIRLWILFEQERGADDGIAHVQAFAATAARIAAACPLPAPHPRAEAPASPQQPPTPPAVVDAPPDPPKESPSMTSDHLDAFGVLEPDAYRTSPGGWRFIYQLDGNLVLYGPDGRPRWASGTEGHAPGRVTLQGDGNLVMVDAAGAWVWHSGTMGHPGAALHVLDGAAVIVSPTGEVLWTAEETAAPAPAPPAVEPAAPTQDAGHGPEWVLFGHQWVHFPSVEAADRARARQAENAAAASATMSSSTGLEVVPPATPTPAPRRPFGRLHADGPLFRLPDGSPWRWQLASLFELPRLIERGEDPAPLLDTLEDIGANGAIVFAQWYWMDAPAVTPFTAQPETMRTIARLLADRQMWMEAVGICDVDPFGQTVAQQIARTEALLDVVGAEPNTFYRIGNEPKENGFDPWVIVDALGLADPSKRPCLMDSGDYYIDDAVKARRLFRWLDYLGDHHKRKLDWASEAAKTGHFNRGGWPPDQHSNGFGGTSAVFLTGEGVKFGPSVDGAGETRVLSCESGAAGFAIDQAGASFHCQSLLRAQPISDAERAWGTRWFDSMAWVPLETVTGSYTHDGFDDFPLEKTSRAGEVAGHWYRDRCYIAAGDPQDDWEPVAKPGMTILERLGTRGQLLTAERS